MKKRKAIIFGLRGIKLSHDEINIISKEKPWGIILFSRNIVDMRQLKELTQSIRNVIKDKHYPILIDQEGGRVCRLNKIIDYRLFSQNYFGRLFTKDKKSFTKYYKIYINKISEILNLVGININTVPVLDVRRKNSHSIIGDRSFSTNPNTVKKIGKLCVSFFKKNKIATVIKHIPGHGLSKSDSHQSTPLITSSKKELINKDFKPFKNLNSFLSMTAHVVYKVYDPNFTATHSKKIINKVIRKHIGFKGIIISDDISMKALKYDLQDNAIKALKAGCNLILHCNGKIEEMQKLVKVVPAIDNFTKKKTSQLYKFLR